MHQHTHFRSSCLALICGSTLVALNQSAQASGFAIPELNITGLATSNAMVANPDSLGAIAYNPAAMSFHEGSSAAAGVILVKPDLSVDTGSGNIDSDGNDVVAIPVLTAHDQLSEEWALGISINAPFGLETDWALETFDDQYPVGSFIPTQTKLEIVAFSPSAAFKVNQQASLSFGVDYYWMREVIFSSKLNNMSTYPNFNLEGDGRSVGFNLGALLVVDNWSFGGSYHSSSKIKAEGTLKDEGGVLPANLSDNVTATLELPWRLQIGVRNQTTDKLAIEFDYTRTGWNTFDTLVVKNEEFGSTIFTSINAFDNANAYRLGATYDFSEATQLRVGYTYDETPQGDKYFSPRVPDADRQLFSLGIGHTLSGGWTIDAGYMYVKFDERTIDSPRSAVAGEELNGTTAVNGSYDSSVHLLGFGVTKHFM
ncbi:MAG: outer membrane protein transport protein [Candidatus Thiodiazotropha sp. (ex Epidulcina cf. delphinae)]|nr:outer membrane protein transport protein [Candidatus Thiodiazotropha sp. (ex Epidulcina cf. delphinae)]MCU7927937.1 outer membrane protein transport protein [Candidatus Thiodiazotropha sp. (ex Dulcina madagascariensis)]